MTAEIPFWMAAKRDGDCAECEGDIVTGDRMVYDADKRKAYCKECGVELIGDDPEQVKRDVKKGHGR